MIEQLRAAGRPRGSRPPRRGRPGDRPSAPAAHARIIAENLAENAIRYAGRAATFTLTVTRAPGGTVLLAADDGVGVGPRDLPRLFERFWRADAARASRGTGLGLAIVKHVVTAGGGTIDASSEPGHGLQVRCAFPD